ncbi:bile acid:sodium symporter family protein [Nocardia asteroides]|uniref:bile acid:sodium symporter family protein n=1 Tax=Nocardia asteroides TaxID=1824 RepID=UPI0037C73CEE
MSSTLISVALPLTLAAIMFGLGLSLTGADFVRIFRNPYAALVALACQLLVLPTLAAGLILLFKLPPLLAIGMMLLAASPGGSTANLYSHLFRGDVALNVSLTAINSVVAVVTVPLLTNFAVWFFYRPASDAEVVGLQFGKIIQVFALVLIPVFVGMAVRRLSASFAAKMDRPVRVGSIVVVVVVVLGAIAVERANLIGYAADIGIVAALFCLMSLSLGYVVPRMLGIDGRQSISCAMEVGIHNGTLAITIAVSVLGNTEMAIPAAVYSILMYPIAAAFGWVIVARPRRRPVLENGKAAIAPETR